MEKNIESNDFMFISLEIPIKYHILTIVDPLNSTFAINDSLGNNNSNINLCTLMSMYITKIQYH